MVVATPIGAPLVYGRRKIQSLTIVGVYAAADRQGTLGDDVDDVLRAISPPPVRHLSVAPLMIVVGDLMTCVRVAFCMPFSSLAGSYDREKVSTISKGHAGRHLPATGCHLG